MLNRMPYGEMTPIIRGVVIFAMCVIVGVAVAEHQVNQLTLSAPAVRSFNLTAEHGVYSFTFMGREGRTSVLYPLGDIRHDRSALVFHNRHVSVTLPTLYEVDIRPAGYWMRRWRDQFINEAEKTKENLAMYIQEMEPWIRYAETWVRQQWERISRMLAGNRQ